MRKINDYLNIKEQALASLTLRKALTNSGIEKLAVSKQIKTVEKEIANYIHQNGGLSHDAQ